MSSSLRFSIIAVLLLAATAIILIVVNMNQSPPKQAIQVVDPPPFMVSYLVAAHSLPAGTLAREDDFTTLSVLSASLPVGAIPDAPGTKINLRGSLVRTFLDTGSTVTTDDLLRPRDRGYLASVLAAGSRAISINVDAESGVSGLIWPGDRVDVVLTHDIDGANLAHRTLSEIILQNVRVIAIDQEIVQGAPANNAVAGKVAHNVTLQVDPDQVAKITIAEHLGKLALAIRSAVEQKEPVTMQSIFSGDVSPALAVEVPGRRNEIRFPISQSGVVIDYGEKVNIDRSFKSPGGRNGR